MDEKTRAYLSEIGRRGGSVKGGRKTKASRKNAKAARAVANSNKRRKTVLSDEQRNEN